MGFFAFQNLSAQEVWRMEVKKTDGTTTSIPVSDIKDVTFIKEVTEIPDESQPSVTPGELIDLGLSVKWASHNVGASKPEEYGGYYAWGETEEKDDYSLDTYLYYQNGNYINIGDNICGTKYDVAHVKWGGSWRMPTKEESKELVEKCSWKWTSYNDTEGHIVTGPNGNSIFIPAARCYIDSFLDYAQGGCYWTGNGFLTEAPSAPVLSYPSEFWFHSYYLRFHNGYKDWDGWHPAELEGDSHVSGHYGFPIRPVAD